MMTVRKYEEFLEALDELGFLTMAETRWYQSTPEGMEQLDMLIKRDRNHPCVILWSAGNEEPLHKTPAGRRIAHAMLFRARQLDPTRPVTAACDRPDTASVYANLDVIGINYGLASYDAVHEKYPDRPVMSTECCATGTTRGWYDEDFPAGLRFLWDENATMYLKYETMYFAVGLLRQRMNEIIREETK